VHTYAHTHMHTMSGSSYVPNVENFIIILVFVFIMANIFKFIFYSRLDSAICTCLIYWSSVPSDVDFTLHT
jgi:hypothetical protein